MIIKGRFVHPDSKLTNQFFSTNVSIEYHIKAGMIRYAYQAGDGYWRLNVGGTQEFALEHKPDAVLNFLAQ